MHYFHERDRDRESLALPNTVWPLMSCDGKDVDDFAFYLNDRGLSENIASENGWYPSRSAGDNFLRVVIPAKSTKAGHVYWQARAVSANVHLRYQSPKGPRYGALVSVRAFPEDVQGEPTPEVVIVEGPMDALAVAMCECDSIALMGMAPGEMALAHLVKLVAKRPALIVLDNEPEAQSAANAIAVRLASAGSKAHVEKLRYFKDLAAMPYKDRKAWLKFRSEEL